MVDRSHLAARRYDLPAGFVDAIGSDEAGVKLQPKTVRSEPEVAAPSAAKPGGRAFTKADLVQSIADRSGLNKTQADKAYAALLGSVTDALEAGMQVRMMPLGTFNPTSGRLTRNGVVETMRAQAKAKGRAKGKVYAAAKKGAKEPTAKKSGPEVTFTPSPQLKQLADSKR